MQRSETDPTFRNEKDSVVSAPPANAPESPPSTHPMKSLLNEYKAKHVPSNDKEDANSALPDHPMNALLDEYKRKHKSNQLLFNLTRLDDCKHTLVILVWLFPNCLGWKEQKALLFSQVISCPMSIVIVEVIALI